MQENCGQADGLSVSLFAIRQGTVSRSGRGGRSPLVVVAALGDEQLPRARLVGETVIVVDAAREDGGCRLVSPLRQAQDGGRSQCGLLNQRSGRGLGGATGAPSRIDACRPFPRRQNC